VRTALPTIVVRAREGASDVVDARVRIDGAVRAERLDGRPLEVDPGSRTVVVEYRDRPALQRSLVVSAGERFRPVVFDVPAPASKSRRTPVAAIVLASVGVLAAGSWAYFGISAIHRYDRDDCASGALACNASRASIRRDLLVADVSAAVTFLTLGAASWLFLRASAREE
jgi:hypothetical protein